MARGKQRRKARKQLAVQREQMWDALIYGGSDDETTMIAESDHVHEVTEGGEHAE